MFQLKPINPSAIPAAMEKVERYRLLNEPDDAESICRDVLAVDPENQAALVNLILSLTDQFSSGLAGRFQEAQELAAGLASEYEQAYYRGIICERRAKAHHTGGTPFSGQNAYDWLHQAMEGYEKAEALQPEGHNDAILRWNTCARMIDGHSNIRPADETSTPMQLE